MKYSFQRIGEPLLNILTDNKPVHHNLYIVLLVLVHGDFVIDVQHLSIDSDPDEAAFFGILYKLVVFSLTPSDNRCKQLDPCAFLKGEYLVNHLIHRLLGYLFPAFGTMGYTYSCIKKSEIIMNLGYRSDSGTGISAGSFLIYGYGG